MMGLLLNQSKEKAEALKKKLVKDFKAYRDSKKRNAKDSSFNVLEIESESASEDVKTIEEPSLLENGDFDHTKDPGDIP